MLGDLFHGLPEPESGGDSARFSTHRLHESDWLRIGKDEDGRPSLLVSEAEESIYTRPIIQLRHIEVTYGLHCVVTEPERARLDGTFTIIRMLSRDPMLHTYFLDVLEVVVKRLSEVPEQFSLDGIVAALVELFAKLSNPATGSVQGLWGELFVIAFSTKPRRVMEAWHNELMQRFDFVYGESRVEVKTAAGRKRVHSFNLSQLSPPSGSKLLIASILCERVARGLSLLDLLRILKNRFASAPALLLKLQRISLETLGESFQQSLSICFDEQLARDSLQFYDYRDVPCVERNIPDEVTNVVFRVDIHGVAPLDIGALKDDHLFAAMLPTSARRARTR